MGKRKKKQFYEREQIVAEIDRITKQCQERIALCEKCEKTKKECGIWISAHDTNTNNEKYREQFWLFKNLTRQIDSAMADYYRRQRRLARLKAVLAEFDTVPMAFVDGSVQL